MTHFKMIEISHNGERTVKTLSIVKFKGKDYQRRIIHSVEFFKRSHGAGRGKSRLKSFRLWLRERRRPDTGWLRFMRARWERQDRERKPLSTRLWCRLHKTGNPHTLRNLLSA